MHISELRKMIDTMEAQGLTEFRCLDDSTGTSEVVAVQAVWIDLEGQVVDNARRACVIPNAYSAKELFEVYQSDWSWEQQYQDFKAFYQWMESTRLKEVYLVENARQVVLIGASEPSLC